MTDKNRTNKEGEEAPIKPDPETLGPDPQEHMEGPISSIVKNIADAGDEQDAEKELEEKDEEEKHD